MIRRLSLFCSLIILMLLMAVWQANEPVEAQTFGTGPWAATFYNNTSFAAPGVAVAGTYTALNFSWGTGAPTDPAGLPVGGIGVDNFSAIFTSTQTFTAGTYTFTLSTDDQATLIINGITVLNITTPGSQSAAVAIPGGAINLEVRYVELTSVAFLQLQWSGGTSGGGDPAATPTITPPPTATSLPPIPPGAITATVVRAAVLNVRAAPSTGAPRLGRILRGQTYAVVGRDPEARWFLLQLGGYQGWAYGYYLYIDANEFNVPIASSNVTLGLAGFPDTGVTVQTQAGLRLRAEPTTNSPQIGRIDWGAFLPVVGRTAGGSWYQVVWKDTVGWVYARYTRLVEGDLRNVPVR